MHIKGIIAPLLSWKMHTSEEQEVKSADNPSIFVRASQQHQQRRQQQQQQPQPQPQRQRNDNNVNHDDDDEDDEHDVDDEDGGNEDDDDPFQESDYAAPTPEATCRLESASGDALAGRSSKAAAFSWPRVFLGMDDVATGASRTACVMRIAVGVERTEMEA